VIRGTRNPVYLIAHLMSQGADAREIMEDYPSLMRRLIDRRSPMHRRILAAAGLERRRGTSDVHWKERIDDPPECNSSSMSVSHLLS
jgi:hypothetical protein